MGRLGALGGPSLRLGRVTYKPTDLLPLLLPGRPQAPPGAAAASAAPWWWQRAVTEGAEGRPGHLGWCGGVPFVVVAQSVRLFATSWTVARQALLSSTTSRSLPKFMSIESVMLPNHLIPCHPLLLWPSAAGGAPPDLDSRWWPEYRHAPSLLPSCGCSPNS